MRSRTAKPPTASLGAAAWITRRRSRTAAVVAASGLAVSAAAGIRLALDPGPDHRAVPVRSAILGAVLAIVVVVATIVFGSSLNTLVSHPALYGWNWNYEMLGNYGGLADIPLPQAGQLLDRDSYVAAWSRVSFDDLRIDGQDVPVLGTTPHATVAPPVLSGHALDAPNQVVLGPTTLAQLHKHVGQTVTVENGVTKPVRLLIVGTATLPAIGAGRDLAPRDRDRRRGFRTADPRPRPADSETSPRAPKPCSSASTPARIRLRLAAPWTRSPPTSKISKATGHRPSSRCNVLPKSSTTAPWATPPPLLGATLAVGAVVALGLTLLTSVGRRRRELALLKTLGFTRRQLAATVAWQASVAVAIGVFIGVPLGIVTGRALWDQFARALHVVPQPTFPVLTIALIAAGALVLANLIAAIPGRQAARTPTAVLLHVE